MAEKTPSKRVTMRTLRRRIARGRKLAMLTCYDATSARWLARGGVDLMLVGDTAAQMILGHDSTLPVRSAFLIELCAAVRRGAPHAYIMGDMPFGSYQCGDDLAMQQAVEFMTTGSVDCVKLEVDDAMAPLVRRMSSAGIPVVAHIGSRPQQVRHEGVVRSQGRTSAEADAIVAAAKVMLDAGAEMLLIEATPAEVSQRVVALAEQYPGLPPVIGCGAGPACHGHVVVLHDLLGMTDWHPAFVHPVGQFGEQLQAAAAAWRSLVESGDYLRDDHPYQMKN